MIFIAPDGMGLAKAAPGDTESASPLPTTSGTTSQPSLPEPTLVTLHLKDASPREAVEALFKHAGISSDRLDESLWSRLDSMQTITLDLVDQPFLIALRELCLRTELEPTSNSGSGQRIGFDVRRPRRATTRPGTTSATTRTSDTTTSATSQASTQRSADIAWRMRIMQPPGGVTQQPTSRPSIFAGPMQEAGPIMVIARGADRSSRASLADGIGPVSRSMSVSMQVLIDPKLHASAIAQSLWMDQADDENGRSLLTENHDEPTASAVRGNSEWSFTITAPLAYTESSKRLALLRGRLKMSIISRIETIEIDPAKPGEQKPDDQKNKILRFSVDPQADGNARVSIKVDRDGRDDEAWRELHDLISTQSVASGVSTDGRPMEFDVRIDSESGDWLHATFDPKPPQSQRHGQGREPRPAQPPKLAKILWHWPVEVQDLVVPVEFRDLALP